jgi:hypothetical protein
VVLPGIKLIIDSSIAEYSNKYDMEFSGIELIKEFSDTLRRNNNFVGSSGIIIKKKSSGMGKAGSNY